MNSTMNESANAKNLKHTHDRVFWVSSELEKSDIRISAIRTTIDSLLLRVEEHVPSNNEIENLRIWLSGVFEMENNVLAEMHSELLRICRDLGEGDRS